MSEMKKSVTIPNISCQHCVMAIEREVGELPGVLSVSANSSEKSATISWDENLTSWAAIRELLIEINYPAQE